MKRLWIWVGLTMLAAGCTSTAPRGSEASSVEQSLSRQTGGGEKRERAQVHADLGRLYAQRGSYDEALQRAAVAIDADGSYAPAHSLRGNVYMALGKNVLAEDSFRQALSLAGNDPEINNDYGWFLCQNGRAKESIDYFKVAIANPLYDTPTRPLANAGLCTLRANDDIEAERYFLRVLQHDKRHVMALYWLADIDYRGNRLEEARGRLKELHAVIEPAASSTWLALRIARKMGDREEEARLIGLMRRKFRDSAEYQKMTRGEFD